MPGRVGEDTRRALTPASARAWMCGPGALPPWTASGMASLVELAGRGENMHRLTFPAHKRLRRKSEFDAAYARGRRFGNGFFAVTASSNDKHGARLGMAVAVRTAGNAVERNRIRRIIRESFRLHQHALPAVDLVVSARPKARGAPGADLHASLAALWKTIIDGPEGARPKDGPSSGRGSE